MVIGFRSVDLASLDSYFTRFSKPSDCYGLRLIALTDVRLKAEMGWCIAHVRF